MSDVLRSRFPAHRAEWFLTAPAMIAWLAHHLDECVLICLDHDLEPDAQAAGEAIDPGTGRNVADFLSAQPPRCPVLIHSTNTAAALGMVRVFEEARWHVARFAPFGDLEWVETTWARHVAELLPPPRES